MKIQLTNGNRYRATISLHGLEKWATNAQILAKLQGAGFQFVVVSGGGSARTAEGTWAHASQEVELPPEISNVVAL